MLKPKKCKKCGREFITYYDTSQFCSKNCFYKSGKPRKPCSVKAKQKISDAKKGKKFSKEHAEKIRVRATGLTGIKARHWLGDKVGKAGVHIKFTERQKTVTIVIKQIEKTMTGRVKTINTEGIETIFSGYAVHAIENTI